MSAGLGRKAPRSPHSLAARGNQNWTCRGGLAPKVRSEASRPAPQSLSGPALGPVTSWLPERVEMCLQLGADAVEQLPDAVVVLL
jgi:hypothetical protein